MKSMRNASRSASSTFFVRVLICIALLICQCKSLVAQSVDGPISISMIALLANPDKYNGKLVRIVGYVNIEYEGTAVYFHKEDKLFSIRKNAIALHLRKEDGNNTKNINGNYVLIEGVFDSNTGHMGLFGGSIHSIKRLAPMLIKK